MKIELKEREKEFYYSILNKFYSKVNNTRPITDKSINFYDFFDENFQIYYGCTKIALVPKNKGARYILKIPMGEHDYCEAEVQVYESARRDQVERFFTPIEVFDSENYDFPVYIQLKAKVNRYSEEDDFYEAQEDWSSLSEESRDAVFSIDMSEKVVDEMLRVYAPEEVEELITFCADEQINDIHAGNYGWYKGAPIIFDFSGIGRNVEKMRGI